MCYWLPNSPFEPATTNETMARKRGAEELEAVPMRPRREAPKRTKVSSSDETRSNSSVPSSCSVSEDSALQSSPAVSEDTRQSSASSLGSEDNDDAQSSLSDSSEESSDAETDDENNERIVTLGGPKKPQMGTGALSDAQDLQSRLSVFLPQLAAANRSLDEDGGSYNIEDIEDDEQHIEMNLGLGVLEEKREDDTSSSDESSEDESELEEEDVDMPVSSGAAKREQSDRDTHVMDKLLGQRRGLQKGGIAEVG